MADWDDIDAETRNRVERRGIVAEVVYAWGDTENGIKEKVGSVREYNPDLRGFNELLVDWMILARCRTPRAFIAHLGLEGQITPQQMKRMQIGEAVPGRHLLNYLRKIFPRSLLEEVAEASGIKETDVFYLKAKEARQRGLPYIDVPEALVVPEALQRAGHVKDRVEITQGAECSTPELHRFARWVTAAVTWGLQKHGKAEGIDEYKTASGIAAYLGIDPWVFLGFMPLDAEHDARELAGRLAEICLTADPPAFFDQAETFFSGLQAKRSVDVVAACRFGPSLTFGPLITLLRETRGYTLSGLGGCCGIKGDSMREIETGRENTLLATFEKLKDALGIEEGTALDEFITESWLARRRLKLDARGVTPLKEGVVPGDIRYDSAQLIRDIRMELALSLTEFGALLGELLGRKPFVKATISHWHAGGNCPPAEVWGAILPLLKDETLRQRVEDMVARCQDQNQDHGRGRRYRAG